MGSGIAMALNLALSLMDRAQQIGSLIKSAHESGVDITVQQLEKLQADDDKARSDLQDAIADARAQGN